MCKKSKEHREGAILPSKPEKSALIEFPCLDLNQGVKVVLMRENLFSKPALDRVRMMAVWLRRLLASFVSTSSRSGRAVPASGRMAPAEWVCRPQALMGHWNVM